MSLTCNGKPLVTLTARGGGDGVYLTRAVIAPGRAMMLLSLTAKVPGRGEVELIASPPLEEACRRLDAGGPNEAFAFGGAVLAPFANRVSGRIEDGLVHTQVVGQEVAIPANGWEGRYAIHGLILDAAAEALDVAEDRCLGRVTLDQPHRWPSILSFDVGWSLTPFALELTVRARNGGEVASPVGLGWHPYFTVPSGDRRQVRLHVPAWSRAAVDDYQSVMPTGEVEAISGTPYDFAPAGGRALGDLYLDDCFLDLAPGPDGLVCAFSDPGSGLKVSMTTRSPCVRAVQTYAPPDRPIVVMEPQFNLADPFGAVWDGRDTGMVLLQPGEHVAYDAAIKVSHFPA